MKKILLFIMILLYTNIYAQELKKTSVQLMWLDQFEFAGFYVAKEKGFYKDLGLDVEFKKYDIHTKLVDSVVKQEVDFGTGSSSLLIEKSKGKNIVLLGTVFQSSPLILLGLKDSNIKNIQDIRNKKVMLTQEQQRFATLQSMLASKNVQINDIEVIEHTFNVDDLIDKKADLMLAYTTNEPFTLAEKGYKSLIFHPKDYGFDFYEEIIFTSKELLDRDPKLVKDFYKATIKGWEYAFENIQEVSQLVYDKYNPQNKSLASLIYEAQEMKKLVFTKDGKIGPITKEKLRLIEHSYRIMGLLKKDLNFDDLIYKNNLKKTIDLSSEEKAYLKDKKTIKMCIDPDWMPFEKNENGKHIGMSSDYIKLLQKEINIPIELVDTKTWSQSLKYGLERKCDIFSLVMSTPEREKHFNFSKPYINIPLVIASDLNAPFINHISQVNDKKLGIVKNYAYGEILRLKYPDIDFIDVDNISDGLKKVEDNKIYGFIGTLATVGYHIQNDYIGQLKITGKFDDTWNLGIGTRNDEPLLNTIFNKAVDSISFEDRQNILNKWISVNYERGLNYDFIIKIFFSALFIIFIGSIIYRQFLLKELNKNLNEKVKEEIEKNNKQHALLTQQAKLAAMGEMIANIAHQWRQPLSVISISATGMKFKKEYGDLSDKEFYDSIDSINNTAQYLSKTIDDFRNFLNENKALKTISIKETIEKSLDLISVKFTNNEINIIKDIEDVEVNTLENELIQVLINIFNNAKDALDDKEVEKLIFINVSKKEDLVFIKIKDTAGGIESDVIKKIFEPYFTTKHQYQGTGIGLYMSEQMITKQMNGKLLVENKKFEYKNKTYKGAQFTIILNTNL